MAAAPDRPTVRAKAYRHPHGPGGGRVGPTDRACDGVPLARRGREASAADRLAVPAMASRRPDGAGWGPRGTDRPSMRRPPAGPTRQGGRRAGLTARWCDGFSPTRGGRVAAAPDRQTAGAATSSRCDGVGWRPRQTDRPSVRRLPAMTTGTGAAAPDRHIARATTSSRCDSAGWRPRLTNRPSVRRPPAGPTGRVAAEPDRPSVHRLASDPTGRERTDRPSVRRLSLARRGWVAQSRANRPSVRRPPAFQTGRVAAAPTPNSRCDDAGWRPCRTDRPSVRRLLPARRGSGYRQSRTDRPSVRRPRAGPTGGRRARRTDRSSLRRHPARPAGPGGGRAGPTDRPGDGLPSSPRTR